MTTARVVLVTTPGADVAEHIVRALVTERLAACGNIVPGVTSIYRWQDDVQRDEEALVVLKTEAERVDALRQRVIALHPYEVPEVVVVPIVDGYGPYLDWIARSTTVERSVHGDAS